MKRLFYILMLLLICFYTDGFAQFGKNKVQYREYDWKYIQSKHFDIYYDKGSKDLAEYSAVMAEQSLASIQNTLNYKLGKRVSMVVYDSHNDFQQTNVISSFMSEGVGGVTELFKNRVVVPFQGDFAQLQHVIHHELVHAVLNDLFHGGTFQSAISTGNSFRIPLWMNEGFAEFESIGGMNTATDMFMRDLAISENLPPLQRLGGYLAYRGGQTFYWYIAENYGKEKVGELLQKLKTYKNVDLAFESAFQMNLQDFSEKWERDLKKYYWPDLELYSDPSEYAIELTDHKKNRNFYNTSPAISPDGEKMAYIADESGLFGIYIRDIDDEKSTRQIVTSFRNQDFEDLNILTPGISWSPDGKNIVISAKSGGNDALYITNVESEDYYKIKFDLRTIGSVTWSPDSRYIAFSGADGKESDIYIYDMKTEKLEALTDDLFSDKYPVWGYNSQELYFISDRADYVAGKTPRKFKLYNHDVNQTDIYRVMLETKEVTKITNSDFPNITSISVSSDDKSLLFVSDKNGIGNIYKMSLETKTVRPITNSIAGITQLNLSNDDSKLLFTVQINGGYDIYMIRFPFERNLDETELPLTKLKQKQKESIALIESFEDSPEEDNELQGWGDFEFEFDRQQVVKANPDIKSNSLTADVIADSTDYGDFVENDYKINFTLDVVLANPSYNTYYGFQGSSQLLYSDIMGNHQLFFQAYLHTDIRNSQFMAGYSYLPDIIDYNFSIYHSAAYLYSNPEKEVNYLNNYLYRFRSYGLNVTASYPFDLFNRLEWGINWMNVSKENMQIPNEGDASRMLFVPQGRFVHDDVLWGIFAPHEGSRYYIGFKGTPKLGNENIGFISVDFDYRKYISIGNYFSFALRGAGGGSFGPDPQRYFVGGTDNWINRKFSNARLPFDNPEDFAFSQFVLPVRGWDISQINGNKYFVTNVEFRFPMFQALVAGPVPILLQGVMGSFFFDMGAAWNDEFVISKVARNGKRYFENVLMSTGIGIRSYLMGLPIKMDIAWRNEYHTWSKPLYLFSLGFDF